MSCSLLYENLLYLYLFAFCLLLFFMFSSYIYPSSPRLFLSSSPIFPCPLISSSVELISSLPPSSPFFLFSFAIILSVLSSPVLSSPFLFFSFLPYLVFFTALFKYPLLVFYILSSFHLPYTLPLASLSSLFIFISFLILSSLFASLLFCHLLIFFPLNLFISPSLLYTSTSFPASSLTKREEEEEDVSDKPSPLRSDSFPLCDRGRLGCPKHYLNIHIHTHSLSLTQTHIHTHSNCLHSQLKPS